MDLLKDYTGIARYRRMYKKLIREPLEKINDERFLRRIYVSLLGFVKEGWTA